jgi:hypothetical protein
MVCHTFWGVARLGGPTWDFESWRPGVSSWKALRVREHKCQRLVNNRSFCGKNVWGPTLKVDRSSAPGRRLCVKWWRNDKPGSGRWSDRGKACVTISR